MYVGRYVCIYLHVGMYVGMYEFGLILSELTSYSCLVFWLEILWYFVDLPLYDVNKHVVAGECDKSTCIWYI